jgi:outer membrane receptor protein involved in Fe transport
MKQIRIIFFVFTLCFYIPVQGQASEASDTFSDLVLEEVIVTAQKVGQQNSLDVPISITAISDDIISKRNLTGMDDYLRYLPGTNFIDRGTGRNSVIIRGITADPGRGGAIAGIYIDETPVQGLGIFGTGNPNLGLVDIERVEVLRGPQGTLYGAGSMSGTVRTLTQQPDLESFGGYVRLGGSMTSGNGDFNSDIQAVLNLPVAEDTFALRAVAYRFDNSGYIRNVAYQDPNKLAGVELFGARLSDEIKDRGSSVVEGFRLGALWQLTDKLDIRFTAMGQDTDQDGVPTIDVLQGAYEQSRFARPEGTDEAMTDDLALYSLILNYVEDNWSLVSASSWIEYEADIDWDVGIFFLDSFGGEVEPPVWLYQRNGNEVFSQEVRWSWDAGGRWRVLLGAFYEDRYSEFEQDLTWEGEIPSDPDLARGDSLQTSLFADLTYGLTERWEISAGARYYDYEFESKANYGGIGSQSKHAETGKTGKLGVNWNPESTRAGDNPLVYFTWSQGFRPGYPVWEPGPDCDADGDGIIEGVGLPFKDIESDDLDSLEFGYKATFAQQRFAFEASLFHISWGNFVVDLTVPPPCNSTMPFNVGKAESQGIEFSFNALLTEDLQLDISGSLVNAELTEDSPGIGQDGDRLPGSPKYNAAIGLEYAFVLAGKNAWARGDFAWVGDYYNTFHGTPPRLGDYTTINLSSGIDLNNWSLEIFINNLADSDAATWANPIWAPYDRETRLRPRTIGARLGYRFGESP